MQFIFHNSYFILQLVPITVFYWTELSCWRKSYSNMATLILGWSHRYKNSTDVIIIWLTVTKYPYLKWHRAPEFTYVFWWDRIVHLFSLLCCPIICFYFLSSVLWCPLRISHKNYVGFFFTSSSVACRRPRAHVFFTKSFRLIWFDFWCFNATFNNISAISWRPVLMVEEAGVPGENHRPWASNW